MSMGEIDKRKFTRIPFEARAEISGQSAKAQGAIENLSMQGMLVQCRAGFSSEERILIRIFLSGASSELCLSLSGHVVRCTDDAVAVQFDLRGIDVDALTHLRYIVGYALGDTDSVMEQYYEFMRGRESSGPA